MQKGNVQINNGVSSCLNLSPSGRDKQECIHCQCQASMTQRFQGNIEKIQVVFVPNSDDKSLPEGCTRTATAKISSDGLRDREDFDARDQEYQSKFADEDHFALKEKMTLYEILWPCILESFGPRLRVKTN